MSIPEPIAALGIPETECDCATCQEMCHRPCWPTPAEAQALMDAGYGPRLGEAYWAYSARVIAPALKDDEGLVSSPSSLRTCTFHDPITGHCQLHALGLKPIEGRLAHHDMDRKPSHGNLHEALGDCWDNPEAQELVARWWTDHAKEPRSNY